MARGRGTGPLELKIYRVKFLKIHKMSFFLLFAPPPLDKICSAAPEDGHIFFKPKNENFCEIDYTKKL